MFKIRSINIVYVEDLDGFPPFVPRKGLFASPKLWVCPCFR